MCSKARCSAIRTACGSTRSSSTPNPARICGPTDSRRTWPISSSCKMKWWRDWPTTWVGVLIYAEAEKGAHSKKQDAIDLAMRGWTLVHSSSLRPPKERLDSIHEARALFDQALKIDPNDAEALAGSARVYGIEYAERVARSRDGLRRQSTGANQSSNRARPQQSPGVLHKVRVSGGVASPQRGLSAPPMPDSPSTRMTPCCCLARANAENALGRYEQAKADMEQRDPLKPARPHSRRFSCHPGDRGDRPRSFRDAAIDEFRKALDVGLRAFSVYMPLGGCLRACGQDGRGEGRPCGSRPPRTRAHGQVDDRRYCCNPPAVLDGVRKAGLAEE